jgi:hypothetical protein
MFKPSKKSFSWHCPFNIGCAEGRGRKEKGKNRYCNKYCRRKSRKWRGEIRMKLVKGGREVKERSKAKRRIYVYDLQTKRRPAKEIKSII